MVFYCLQNYRIWIVIQKVPWKMVLFNFRQTDLKLSNCRVNQPRLWTSSFSSFLFSPSSHPGGMTRAAGTLVPWWQYILIVTVDGQLPKFSCWLRPLCLYDGLSWYIMAYHGIYRYVHLPTVAQALPMVYRHIFQALHCPFRAFSVFGFFSGGSLASFLVPKRMRSSPAEPLRGVLKAQRIAKCSMSATFINTCHNYDIDMYTYI